MSKPTTEEVRQARETVLALVANAFCTYTRSDEKAMQVLLAATEPPVSVTDKEVCAAFDALIALHGWSRYNRGPGDLAFFNDGVRWREKVALGSQAAPTPDIIAAAIQRANTALGQEPTPHDVGCAERALRATDASDLSPWAFLVIGYVTVAMRAQPR